MIKHLQPPLPVKIWITGCNGMLGHEFADACSRSNITWVGSDREIDITDRDSISHFASLHQPQWIINCAAYTAVDKAESEHDLARLLNVEGPGNLAELANRLGIPLIHFSTDYVFDGFRERPWCEDDATNPLSFYGLTKRDGEKRIFAATDRFFLFRISWLYGQFGSNFVRKILRLLREQDVLRVISDQRGAPTWAQTLVENIVSIIVRNEARYGIYHYADDGIISWHEFATAIRDISLDLGLITNTVPIEAIPTEAYPLPAQRPRNSAFDKSRVRDMLNFKLHHWRKNLATFLAQERDASRKS